MCEYIYIHMNLYCTPLESPYSNLSKLVKIYSDVKKYDTLPIITSLLCLTLMDKDNIWLDYCDIPKPGGPLTTRQPAEYS